MQVYRVAVEIGVLGPLLVTVGGRAIRLPAKQQTLLAVLALEPNAAVSADRLMIALWGEDVSPSALATLQSHVFQLRRTLAAEQSRPGTTPDEGNGATVETDRRGYRLRIAPQALDAQRFQSHLAEARGLAADDPRAAVQQLLRALALWRRPGAPDVGEEPAALAELDRLSELRNGAVDQLVGLQLALGDPAAVIPELRRELREAPYREPWWASLMTALAATGRKAEALIAYRDATVVLRDELDVAPSAELQALAARIRDGGSGPPDLRRTRTEASPDEAATTIRTSATAGRWSVPPHRPALAIAALGIAVVVVVSGSRLLPTTPTPIGPSALVLASVAPAVILASDGVGRIDASGQVTASVSLAARPDAVTAGAGSLWISSPPDDAVIRVDPAADAVLQRIRVGHAPAGIAFGFGSIWVANSDERTVSRIDPTTNDVVATIGVGAAPTGVTADDHWVWVTNRLDHSVTRIDPDDGATKDFAVGSTPIGIAAAHGSIWVVDGSDSLVERVDPVGGAVTRTVGVGSDPTSIAASPDGDALWVVNTGSGTVFRIDAETATVTAAQKVGDRPTGIVVDRSAVWVAVSSTNEILRLDPESAQVVGRTALQATPRALTDEDGRVVFTADAPAGSHRGGALRVLTGPGDVPESPDPTYWPWGLGWTPQMTNDPLVTYKRVGGPDGLTFVADLAEDIPDSADGGLTWTFRLRPGLRYSDGRAVQAGDALGSFERGVIAGAVTQAGMFGNTEIVGSSACGAKPPCDLARGITTDDAARTITFHLAAADEDFPERLFGVPILPSDTPLAQVRAPVPATGPYEVATFGAARSVRLVRNPLFHVWSADAEPDGNPDEIDVTASTATDPTTEIVSGNADVLQIETESAARLGQLRTTVPGQLHVAPPLATWLEVMNTNHPPFDDVRVRDAINLATDRTALVDAWGGSLTATVTCQLLPPGFIGYERYCPWTVDRTANGNWLGPDLDRAQGLIGQAGVRGTAVTVLGADDGGQHVAVARYFTDLLRSLGFRATTRLMGFDSYFTFLGDHPDQVQMAGYWVRDEDRAPATMIVGGFSCPSLKTAIERNPVGWCSQALDARMTSALRLGDTDPVGADEQWAAIDHAIVDASPAVMPFNTTDVTLLSNRVGGFEDNPVMLLYDQLWVH